MKHKMLTVTEVADILNISQSTVRRHIKLNDIPHFKIGKLVRIPEDCLMSYLHDDLDHNKQEKTV